MKRFLHLVCAFLLVQSAAFAQSFKFQYQGADVADGATVSIPAEVDIFGELACETNPAANPTTGLMLVSTSSSAVSGQARLEILAHTFRAKTVQWCMGDQCVPMNDVTTLDKNFSGKSLAISFDAFTIRQEGYLLAKLTATVGNQTQTVYIEFINGQHSAVTTLADAQGVADIYDLSGNLVLRRADADARRNLRPGIYLVSDGRRVRKVNVK